MEWYEEKCPKCGSVIKPWDIIDHYDKFHPGTHLHAYFVGDKGAEQRVKEILDPRLPPLENKSP